MGRLNLGYISLLAVLMLATLAVEAGRVKRAPVLGLLDVLLGHGNHGQGVHSGGHEYESGHHHGGHHGEHGEYGHGGYGSHEEYDSHEDYYGHHH